MPRKPGFIHSDEVRKKIKCKQLINRLMTHINSDEPILDASQVNAAKALLNKVLPDLKAVEVTGDKDNPVVVEDISQHDIARRIAFALRDTATQESSDTSG